MGKPDGFDLAASRLSRGSSAGVCELIGLRRHEVDLKARTVHVRRGANLVDGDWIITGPKAGSLRTSRSRPILAVRPNWVVALGTRPPGRAGLPACKRRPGPGRAAKLSRMAESKSVT